MDTGYTYGSPERDRLAVYCPPSYEPPEVVIVKRDGAPVEFVRLSDRELDCGTVAGVRGRCESFECHREVLGQCQCGRHKGLFAEPDDERPPIRLARAVR